MELMQTTITDNNEQLAALTLRRIEKLVCEHKSSVKDGWRAIIMMREVERDENGIAKTAGEPYFLLDVQSNRGGGDYAWTKMNTLKNDLSLAATGMETPKEFAKRVEQLAKDDNLIWGEKEKLRETAKTISTLGHIKQLPHKIASYLHTYDLTAYEGAIRVPYEALVVEPGNKHRQEFGETLVSFSGAEEWQNLLLSTYLFSSFQRILNSLWKQDQIWFNLRELKKHPQIEMLIKFLEVLEA